MIGVLTITETATAHVRIEVDLHSGDLYYEWANKWRKVPQNSIVHIKERKHNVQSHEQR